MPIPSSDLVSAITEDIDVHGLGFGGLTGVNVPLRPRLSGLISSGLTQAR